MDRLNTVFLETVFGNKSAPNWKQLWNQILMPISKPILETISGPALEAKMFWKQYSILVTRYYHPFGVFFPPSPLPLLPEISNGKDANEITTIAGSSSARKTPPHRTASSRRSCPLARKRLLPRRRKRPTRMRAVKMLDTKR